MFFAKLLNIIKTEVYTFAFWFDVNHSESACHESCQKLATASAVKSGINHQQT